ncbi:unnamed protein product [Anisakis simplex]|uniref:5'-tyrosyl-DNA phosphodiesterase (inferred by orthology to a C. elegans protein) n=1 Tax=Anisakis simplex TaxID=6269 RepID=A0A0M3KA40_ANISI|nr:unnamed protein product [Anisakis simplex]
MKVHLLNTHLESMKEHSDIRKAQMQECFDLVKEWNDGRSLIVFGGDLNIRDNEADIECYYEILNVGTLPDGFQDAWVAAGSQHKWRFTWDSSANDNVEAGGARCRFDRLYFHGGGVFSSVDFSLHGKDRIRRVLCFPSDHWAVLAKFHI